MVMQFIP